MNLRPFFQEIRISSDAVEMDLWVTPYGTARPDEVLTLLGLNDLLDQGMILERTELELEDEATARDGSQQSPGFAPYSFSGATTPPPERPEVLALPVNQPKGTA
jgi:hypothetical protein